MISVFGLTSMIVYSQFFILLYVRSLAHLFKSGLQQKEVVWNIHLPVVENGRALKSCRECANRTHTHTHTHGVIIIHKVIQHQKVNSARLSFCLCFGLRCDSSWNRLRNRALAGTAVPPPQEEKCHRRSRNRWPSCLPTPANHLGSNCLFGFS